MSTQHVTSIFDTLICIESKAYHISGLIRNSYDLNMFLYYIEQGAKRPLKLRKYKQKLSDQENDIIVTSDLDASTDTESESTVECTPPLIAVDGQCSKSSLYTNQSLNHGQ